MPALLAVTLALAACTSDEEKAADVPEASDVSVTPSPTRTAVTSKPTPGPTASRQPLVGACYRLTFRDATAPTNQRPPVRCSERHTAQTYFVGRLDTVVDGHLLAVDSHLAQEQVRETCPRQLHRYIGGSPRDRALARLKAVWFSPTLQQSDEGASWFRCDVVALDRASTLADLPPPARLRGILERPSGLAEVGLCGTAAPGEPGFQRVICSRRHAWKALTVIDLEGGRTYPGVAAVRRAGESRCRNHVRRVSGSPDRFRYGWEWPTARLWNAGQHFGYCWAPD